MMFIVVMDRVVWHTRYNPASAAGSWNMGQGREVEIGMMDAVGRALQGLDGTQNEI